MVQTITVIIVGFVIFTVDWLAIVACKWFVIVCPGRLRVVNGNWFYVLAVEFAGGSGLDVGDGREYF